MSQVHLVLTMMTVITRGVAWLMLKEIVRLHGIPESIVSNRHTNILEGITQINGEQAPHVYHIPPTNPWGDEKS